MNFEEMWEILSNQDRKYGFTKRERKEEKVAIKKFKKQAKAFDFIYGEGMEGEDETNGKFFRFHENNLGYDFIGVDEGNETSVYIQKPGYGLMINVYTIDKSTPVEAIRDVIQLFDISDDILLYEKTIRGNR